MFQMRVLKNDFARYNLDEDEVEELDQDENGWKIIHTDVFRFPPYKSLLCAILGKHTSSYQVLMLVVASFSLTGSREFFTTRWSRFSSWFDCKIHDRELDFFCIFLGGKTRLLELYIVNCNFPFVILPNYFHDIYQSC